MTKRLRLLLLAFGALTGLALAAPALAAYTQPYLAVQQSSYKVGAPTTVGVLVTAAPESSSGAPEDPTAKVTVFSPTGYGNNLSQAPGTTIGKAVAYVQSASLGGLLGPLTGPVVVGNPADPTLMAQSAKCTGSPTSQHVWVLNTTIQGQTIQIPAFVNVVGPYVVQQICLQSPADPANTFKAQLVLANYTLKGVFTNGSSRGEYQWAADFTPFVPGTVTPNPTATVEWRTYVGLPSSVTFKRARSKSSVVTFKGALHVEGLRPTGVRLHLYSATKAPPSPNFSLGTAAGLFGYGKFARTKAVKSNGKYSITRKRPKGKKPTFFQMRFEDYLLSLQSGDNCDGPSPSGQAIPCNGETIAPLTSNMLRVAPRRR